MVTTCLGADAVWMRHVTGCVKFDQRKRSGVAIVEQSIVCMAETGIPTSWAWNATTASPSTDCRTDLCNRKLGVHEQRIRQHSTAERVVAYMVCSTDQAYKGVGREDFKSCRDRKFDVLEKLFCGGHINHKDHHVVAISRRWKWPRHHLIPCTTEITCKCCVLAAVVSRDRIRLYPCYRGLLLC